MTLKERLDQWWDTEPFGWDNNDTYQGILKLMQDVQNEEREKAKSEVRDESRT